MIERLRAFAPSRGALLLTIALGVAISIPALWSGFQWDDYLARLVFTNPDGRPSLQRARQLWSLDRHPANGKEWALFSRNVPRRNHELMDEGILPWWTAAEWRIDFFRPVSWLSHAADFALWPDSAAAMHAQSLLWFAALIALAGVLYRRLFASPVIAALATLLYAIDDAFALPTYFITNRHALMGAFFGLLTFWAHHRWRRDGWRPGAFLAPLSLALGMWSYEIAVAAAALILCYELLLRSGPLRRRLLTLLPSAAVVIVWRLTYVVLGLGVTASESYIDLAQHPMQLLPLLVTRVPVLLTAQLFSPPSDMFAFLPHAWAVLVWTADAAFIVFAAAVLFPLLRTDATARFFGASMLLAVLPLCSTIPNDRLLAMAGFAAMGLVALFLHQFPSMAPAMGRGRRIATRTLWVAMIAVHVVLAPPARIVRGLAFAASSWAFERAAASAPIGDDPSRLVLVVNAPLAPLNFYLLTIRVTEGLPVPDRTLPMASGVQALEIRRTDRQTLTVHPDGGFLAHAVDRLMRDRDHPMFAGQQIRLEGMTVTVTRTNAAGRPEEASFRFDRPLEDPGLQWFQWKDGRYARFTPPGIGQSVRLAAVDLPQFARPAMTR